jgi:DNA-binding XRE family transcriptional regulator
LNAVSAHIAACAFCVYKPSCTEKGVLQMQEKTDLATFLKEWRKEHGLTQAVAAKELGIVLPTYRGLEQGRLTPYAQVVRMATKGWEADGGPLRMLLEASGRADHGQA